MPGAKARPLIDTIHEVHTPEGVALQLPAAGPWLRALAWAIDACLRVVLLIAVMLLGGLFGQAGTGLLLIVAFGLLWLYPVLFEVLWNGQTPGKRALRLQVVRSDGTPIGWRGSFVRTLMRTVDMLPFGYAAGLVCTLFDRSGRRLGDLVAGTLVIHLHAPSTVTAHAASEPSGPVTAGAALPALQLSEQAAIMGFGERSRWLTAQRRQELASLTGPLFQGDGEQREQLLLAAAHRLQGH